MGGTYLQPQHLEDKGRRVSMSVSSLKLFRPSGFLFVFVFSLLVQFADEVSDTVAEAASAGEAFLSAQPEYWLAVLVR